MHEWYDEFHEQPKQQPENDVNDNLVMVECTKWCLSERWMHANKTKYLEPNKMLFADEWPR